MMITAHYPVEVGFLKDDKTGELLGAEYRCGMSYLTGVCGEIIAVYSKMGESIPNVGGIQFLQNQIKVHKEKGCTRYEPKRKG